MSQKYLDPRVSVWLQQIYYISIVAIYLLVGCLLRIQPSSIARHLVVHKTVSDGHGLGYLLYCEIE